MLIYDFVSVFIYLKFVFELFVIIIIIFLCIKSFLVLDFIKNV